MGKIHLQYYKSPYGELQLTSYQGKLCMCDWRYRKMRAQIDKRLKDYLNADFEKKDDAIINKAVVQLEEYFHKERKEFDIALVFAGTDFQKRVWSELKKVPYGKSILYLELAKRMGDEKAIRAVATANGANALSIFIPCHRVIGSNGDLTGYAGGLKAKRSLLELECEKPVEKQFSLF